MAWNGAYLATRPSDVAAARPAPGPTAWMHVLAAVKLSPSMPSRAWNSASRDAVASASKPTTRWPVASSPRDRRQRRTGGTGLARVGSGSLAGRDRRPPVDGARRQPQALDRHRPGRAVAQQAPQGRGVLGGHVVRGAHAETDDDEGLSGLGLARRRHGHGGPLGVGECERGHQHEQQDDEGLDGMAADHGRRVQTAPVRGRPGHGLESGGSARRARLPLPIVDESTLTTLAIVAVVVALLALALAVGAQQRLARVRRDSPPSATTARPTSPASPRPRTTASTG